MFTLLNGRKIATKIKKQIKKEISAMEYRPGLAVILIGKNPASKIYVRLKEKACRETGIGLEKYLFPASVPQQNIIKLIQELSRKKKIHGILVQFPLPRQLNASKIVSVINPRKDVDGFHPTNVEKISAGKPDLVSPVLDGIMELLKATKMDLKEKRALILANSEIFARPLAKLLEKKGIISSIRLMAGQNEAKSKADKASCKNSTSRQARESDLKIMKNVAARADILIVAVGRPRFVTADMVKKNAVVIDVGYNLIGGKSVGDVDFKSVSKKAAFLTPVPGGVGPMTVAMLVKNVLKAYKLFN